MERRKKCKMRLRCSKAGDEAFASNLDMVPQSKSKDSLYVFFLFVEKLLFR